MKKLLTVSFIALISVISAGNAAIPDKTYVDDAAAQKVDRADVVDLSRMTEMTEENLGNLVGQVAGADVATFYHMITNQAITGNSEKILNLGSGDMGMNVVPNLESPNKESIVGGINSVYDVVKTNKSNIETLTTADATNLQAAKDYANSLASNYDAAGSAATAQTNAVEYTDGKIAELAATYETKTNVSLAVQEAKDYADDKASEAGTDAKSYADEELLKKVDKTGHTASQVVITDSTGTITTAAQIANTQVSGLGGLATKSTIANADVAADAAIAQSKIAGLEDALAAKVDKANIITKTGHTYEEIVAKDVAEQDTLVPSFAIMYDMGATLRERILENVSDIETNSGEIDSLKTMVSDNATDIAAKVDKAAVVVSGGTNTMTGATVANDANKDTYVPTVAYAQQMAASAANDAVAGVDVKFQEYVPYAMGEAHADGFVVTDATGNVYVEHGVPASITKAMDEKISAKLNKPEGECVTPGNCVLVFSGYTDDGEITLVWEKVARSISEVQAE